MKTSSCKAKGRKLQQYKVGIMSEYDGGTIDNKCPHCGQFCKVPDTYNVEFHKSTVDRLALAYFPSLVGDRYIGCFGDSYCNRCKKPVKLSVEFI